MRRTALLFSLAAAFSFTFAIASTTACTTPPSPSSEGEGEGAHAGEGEGAHAGEGEGAPAGEGEGEGASTGEGEGEGEGTATTTTWFKDVLPVARANCEVCHTPGGIGPFDIEDATTIAGLAPTIAAYVQSRLMPPWMPSRTCSGHTYAGDRSLSDDQIALFTAWADGGFVMGDAADASGSVPALVGLDRVDVSLQPAQSYTPVKGTGASPDDYHCFLLDPASATNASPTVTTQKFVTGFDIAPGTASMVHHVILYAVPRTNAENTQAQAGGNGWTCFGGAQTGGNETVLAAWAPGSNATLYPAGTGIPIQTSDVIVMQIHYNFNAQPTPVPDLTTAKLKLEDSVANQSRLLPVVDNSFTIPPNTNDYTDAVTTSAAPFGLGLKIWGLLPHMHQLGKHINVTLNSGSSDAQCLVDIPAWDFHWQQDYFFTDGAGFVQTQNGDQVTVSCTWDNTTGSPVSFGENTTDEMCLAFAYATL